MGIFGCTISPVKFSRRGAGAVCCAHNFGGKPRRRFATIYSPEKRQGAHDFGHAVTLSAPHPSSPYRLIIVFVDEPIATNEISETGSQIDDVTVSISSTLPQASLLKSDQTTIGKHRFNPVTVFAILSASRPRCRNCLHCNKSQEHRGCDHALLGAKHCVRASHSKDLSIVWYLTRLQSKRPFTEAL